MRISQQTFKVCVAVLTSLAGIGAAAACAPVDHLGARFTVCPFDPARADIRLFLKNGKGDVYGGFDSLADDIAAQGGALVFAMNAGMYQPDYSPVGLYVEKGRELQAINRRAGKGNFAMKPNGVFWARPGAAGVAETSRYVALNARADYATQSGPMLVIGGKLHPKIHEDGTSEKTRNGVGQCDDGKIRFAISEGAVTFYTFATLFRDKLKCGDALFLDGSVSALYAPALKRNDGWKPMGPIVGVVEGLKK